MSGPRVVLVGPMGVGKSTVGRVLAERLGCAFRDTDDDIVAARGRTVADIFEAEGEAHFRGLEKAAVATALAEHGAVLALGGGAVLDAGTRRLLAAHPVVHLSMDVEEAVRRIGLIEARPLLAVNPHERWRELTQARHHLYLQVATRTVRVDGRMVDEVVAAVLAGLTGRVRSGGSELSR